MFSILGVDGKEYGPVSAAKIKEWMAGGRANLETKARRSGDTDWRTLADFPEFNPAAQPATPPPVDGTTPAPAPAAIPQPALSGDPKAIASELLSRAAPLDVFGCLGNSFELWKAHLLPLVGVTFVLMVMTFVLGLIPVLGPLSNLLLNGIFYGGLYYYYLGKLRGEPREFPDLFAGFTKAPGPLILASLMILGLTMGAAIFCIGPWVAAMVMANFATASVAIKALIVSGMFLCCLPLIYLSVSWAFTFMLVIDKGLTPWTAMEVSRRVITRNWFRVFFVMFLSGILAMLGLIGLIVGVIFTLPLGIGALVCAYEELCNAPPRHGS